jgi:hypothetical protein
MDVDITGDVDAPGEKTGIVLALGFELWGHGGHIAVIPHRVGAADGKPGAVGGDAHGFAKGAEVGVEDASVGAHQDNLAGLVGGDDQTDPELLEKARQIRGVDAVQGLCGRGRLA